MPFGRLAARNLQTEHYAAKNRIASCGLLAVIVIQFRYQLYTTSCGDMPITQLSIS